MTFNQWVLDTYKSIPESKRHLYSTDTLIASVCYYRRVKGIHPVCLSEAEAKAFVNALVMQEDKTNDGKRELTEKGIIHNLKRNLVGGTAVDEVYKKCEDYLKGDGVSRTDAENNESLYNILIDSGIIENSVAAKLGSQIIEQQKRDIKKKQSIRPKEYIPVQRYKFFTPKEIEEVKKKSTTLSSDSKISVDKEIIMQIVDEIIRIIEEVKGRGTK